MRRQESFETPASHTSKDAGRFLGFGISIGFVALLFLAAALAQFIIDPDTVSTYAALAIGGSIIAGLCGLELAAYTTAKLQHQKILSDMNVDATKELTKAIEKLKSDSVENDGNKEE